LEDLGDDNWQVLRKDAFTFLEQIEEKYDLIFADPPFGLKQIEKVISLVFERGLLNEGGVLIIEHGQENDFGNKTHFKEIRKYGGVNFSFFQED
jgi:16S rRNA G966 N2-methylase RsmD